MPASLRAHLSRAPSLRPYDTLGRSPTASPANNPCLLARAQHPCTEPYQDPDADADIPPDNPGLPTYADYKRIEADYLRGLSPRKRDKALITQVMFDKIWDVLHQPDACTVETPQFRFWVRKMFTLARPIDVGDGHAGWGGWTGSGGVGVGAGVLPVTKKKRDAAADSDGEDADLELERAMGIGRDASANDCLFTAVVLHENRPVAIMEQLYELFSYCHVRAGHGGRDKTCAVIRQHYSWVPKELTAQFVKACPTCVLKRNGHGGAVSVPPGIDVGLAQKRAVVGRRGRARTPRFGGSGGMPASIAPSSLGCAGWPTTGGPLDPANPKPCGVRERERERDREWLRAHDENASKVETSSPASLRGATTRSAPREGCVVPRVLTFPFSPTPSSPRTTTTTTTTRRQQFAADLGNTWRDRGEKYSPARTTGLPSLASALSNESLDENLNLTGLAQGSAVPGECLPPALRPLRLSGPIPSDPAPALALTLALAPAPALAPAAPAGSTSTHFFQIDPVLLSFNNDHPGGYGPSAPVSDVHARTHGRGSTSETFITSTGRLGAPSEPGVDVDVDVDVGVGVDPSTSMPALETSDSLPDSSFESSASMWAATRLPLSDSMEDLGQSQCGSRYRGYDGYREGSLALLLPCSTDEELDGVLSLDLPPIMTDA